MPSQTISRALLVSVILVPLTPARAQTLEQIETANSLVNEFETPHTKWARPYVRGKLRVLFLMHQNPNINALPLRHCVELAQRFDIQPQASLVMTKQGNTYAITYRGGSGVFGGKVGEQRLARLLKKDYDAYVVNGPVMGYIPRQAREHILSRIRAGAGLGLFYTPGKEDAPLLKALGIPASRAANKSKASIERFVFGQGRVAILSEYPAEAKWNIYRPTGRDMVFGFGMRRDYFYEIQGRALLWLAKREPPLTMGIDAPAKPLSTSQLPQHVARVHWSGNHRPSIVRVRIRTEGRGGKPVRFFDTVGATKSELKFKLPLLPAGRYWIEAIALQKRAVLGWTRRPLEVVNPGRVAGIDLLSESGEAGQPIRGRVRLGTEKLPTGTEVQVRAIDRFGRIVARHGITDLRRANFLLPTNRTTPNYLGVEVVLRQHGQDMSYAYHPGPYTIIQRKQHDFNYMLWGRLYASQFLEVADDMMAANGITTRMETSNVPWWYMTRAGMNYAPYCSSGLFRLPDMGPQEPMVDEKGNLHVGCWNHEPLVSLRLRKWLAAERDYAGHGVLVYSMGDEVGLFGSCLHPQCWQQYRLWLQRQYGTIAALNRSWSTRYKSFAEIQPRVDKTSIPWYPKASQRTPWHLTWANNEHSSLGPTSGSTAWKKDWINYPRYVDRRSFQYWNFANYCRRFRQTAKGIDPHAKAGIEGTDIGLDGDIDAIVRYTDWWMPYGGENSGETNEVIRSIASPSYLHGNFAGGQAFWDSFLRGANTMGKWRIDNTLTPSMRLAPAMRRMVNSARIVFDGLGTLLNGNPGSPQLDDGIVMLHSMASVKMAQVGDGPSYGIFRMRDNNGRSRSSGPQAADHVVNRRSHRAWHRNIRAIGLQFRYTTDGQIRRGEFDVSKYKVLILSQYEVIHSAEEKLIRRFVAAGGTVIADVRPGIYGPRGKSRQGGVLDDLFGVQHLKSVKAIKQAGVINGTLDGKIRLPSRDIYVNPSVKVTTGKALGYAGQTPICIVRSTGKGRAILLNFAMWSFPKLAIHRGDAAADNFFRKLIASTGVRPTYQALAKDGKPHTNLELMRWKTGPGVEVVAVHGPLRGTWPEPNGTPKPFPAPFSKADKAHVAITLKTRKPRYIYEMTTGRYARRPLSMFPFAATPFQATLLTVSDRPLHVPRLSVATPRVAQGSDCTLHISIPAGAQSARALKVTVQQPNGKPAPWFTRSLVVRDGLATLNLPMAHNERTGTWKVIVKDLMITQTAAITFEVKKSLAKRTN